MTQTYHSLARSLDEYAIKQVKYYDVMNPPCTGTYFLYEYVTNEVYVSHLLQVLCPAH